MQRVTVDAAFTLADFVACDGRYAGWFERVPKEGSNGVIVPVREYLAAGLPVLATPIPECEAVPEVAVASTSAGFSDLLDRARGSRRSDDFRHRARERARQNDWNERALAALSKLGLPVAVG